MKALIQEAQAGSTQARTRLAILLRPRVTSMARYYARKSNLEYDDLIQEAWCAVYEALPETRLHIGSPEQYLLRRARWAMLDYLKWSLRRQMDPLEDWTPEGSTPGADQDTITCVTVEKLARALTPIQQAILDLLLQGENCTGAAQALGCTTANVSYHLGQVRRRVAKAFPATAEHLAELVEA